MKPQFTIMIVDDDKKQSNLFASAFKKALDQVRGDFLKGSLNDLEFNFQVFSIEKPENFGEFRQRLVNYLSGQTIDGLAHPNTIKLILFDYQIKLVGGTDDKLFGPNGVSLAHAVREVRPDIIRALRTQFRIDTVAIKDTSLFAFRSVKEETISDEEKRDLARKMLSRIRDYMTTPFWDALKEYANEPKTVMHALAISDAEIIKKSWTLNDILDFYSINYFRAEASGTQPPLASVFSPNQNSSLGLALRNFCRSFGAEGVFFSTAGTSTTNKIIYQAYCGAKDWVLVDRNCHISHHYGIALAGASVTYVEPIKNNLTGNYVAATPTQFIDTLEKMLDAGHKPPRVISTTNCTFDGVIIDVEKLVRGIEQVYKERNIHEEFRNTLFLIDEAWFGFARFHPEYSRYSSMQVAKRLDVDSTFQMPIRIYSTTSVHKTMFGFRQSSVLLSYDTTMSSKMMGQSHTNKQGSKIERAMYAFTTTSPHLGIMASLDICARHMWFEGISSIQQALDSASFFTDRMKTGLSVGEKPLTDYFEIEADPLHELVPVGVVGRDATKISLKSKAGHSGAELRQAIWDYGRIQVNKFGQDDVLLMFMPGFTNAKSIELLEGLTRVVRQDARFNSLSIQNISSQRKKTVKVDFETPNQNLSQTDIGKFLFSPPQNKKEKLLLIGPNSLGGENGEYDWYSRDFVSPYPPGYPVLVPGQKITRKAVEVLHSRLGTEIHGLIRENGKAYVYAFTKKK